MTRRGARGRPLPLAAACVLAVAAVIPTPAGGVGQDPQIRVPRPFQIAVDMVTVDVSVRDGNVPVAGLTAGNFALTDNGVPQDVEVVSLESLPIDVTIAIDTSGSMFADLGAVLTQANDAAALVRDGDRLRTVTFATFVKAGGFRAATDSNTVEAPPAWGATSLVDGLAMALMNARVDERRHLVIAYTDGYDNVSMLGLPDLDLISRRTDSVLYVLQVTNTDVGPTTPDTSNLDTRRRWRPSLFTRVPTARGTPLPLGGIARNTGGDIRALAARADSVAALREIIDLFRGSYVVAYRATGVELPGWHDLEIRVTGRDGLAVRHRRGYFIGGG